MRVFIEENLSPTLVTVGHQHDDDTTCAPAHRGLLDAPDSDILAFCAGDDRVCVTNNADDFIEPRDTPAQTAE